jgi:hypothetical protein
MIDLSEEERQALRTSGSWPHVGTDLFVAVERIKAAAYAEGRRDALAEAAEARMAYSKGLREAFREHNANRDLARLQPRRPDLRTWADALESTSHWLRARAEADPGERKAGS